MREIIASPVPALALLASMVLVAFLITVTTVTAQEGACETAQVIIEGGDPQDLSYQKMPGKLLL